MVVMVMMNDLGDDDDDLGGPPVSNQYCHKVVTVFMYHLVPDYG